MASFFQSLVLLAFSYLIIPQLIITHKALAVKPVDTTLGFVSLPLNLSYYHIQRPYDVPLNQRYSFIHGVHKCRVYSTETNLTFLPVKLNLVLRLPNSYSSGIWQFEGHGYVPNGTSGVNIMQVFEATPPGATTLMLKSVQWVPSILQHGSSPSAKHLQQWFKLNVIHDVDAAKLKVYIDGYLKLEAKGRGGTSHAFKCGVYAQFNDSYYMESRWKHLKVLRKCD